MPCKSSLNERAICSASINSVLPAFLNFYQRPSSSFELASMSSLPRPPVCIAVKNSVHATCTLRHPDVSRFGVCALDDINRQYVWLDDPDGPYSWPMPL